eukprot:m.128971 g.128971  ORF g.128971 m.128971 type:complete len:241 (-) comp15686_c0_seq2:3473-4195(-)
MNHWHNQNKQPTKPIHHKHILNNQHLLNTTNPSFMNCWFLFFIHAFHQYMCPSSIHVQARSLCTTGTSRHFKSQVSSLKQWLPDFANEDKKKQLFCQWLFDLLVQKIFGQIFSSHGHLSKRTLGHVLDMLQLKALRQSMQKKEKEPNANENENAKEKNERNMLQCYTSASINLCFKNGAILVNYDISTACTSILRVQQQQNGSRAFQQELILQDTHLVANHADNFQSIICAVLGSFFRNQ